MEKTPGGLGAGAGNGSPGGAGAQADPGEDDPRPDPGAEGKDRGGEEVDPWISIKWIKSSHPETNPSTDHPIKCL